MPFNSLFTWDQAATELQLRLGNRTDLGAGTANRIDQWLNSAQYQMASIVSECEDLDNTFSFFTIDGQSQYSETQIIPPLTNVIGIKDMRNNTVQVSMRRFPWNEFRSLNQQAPGPPLRWARWGNTIALDPKPDAGGPWEILIDYRTQPIFGTVMVPNWVQEYWITYAEHVGWKALMKPDRAQSAFQILPAQLQVQLSQIMDRDRWESMMDDDQTIAPVGFQYPYTFGVS